MELGRERSGERGGERGGAHVDKDARGKETCLSTRRGDVVRNYLARDGVGACDDAQE